MVSEITFVTRARNIGSSRYLLIPKKESELLEMDKFYTVKIKVVEFNQQEG